MSRSISPRTTLEGLKKEAKRLLKALRAGDPAARRRFDEGHLRNHSGPTLRDAQHLLAREHGFESWAVLREQVELQAFALRSADARADEFLDLTCLHYGIAPGTRVHSDYPEGPERWRRAARLLEGHPELARQSIHTAVVCGALDEVTRRLSENPEAARERGGREAWEPLVFLCYGRLPTAAARENAAEIAAALLDRGADPNAAWSYDWQGREMPMTALCGVIGDGEKGPVICPPHPRADALARMLLDRGVDPNQGQALYHTMLRGDDDRWLRLLIPHGLGPRHPISWEPAGSESNVFEYLLEYAVGNNQLARAGILLEQGAPSTSRSGRNLYERALLAGNVAMAELLARHGAIRTELHGNDAFRAACARLDRETAARMLAREPRLIEEANQLLAGDVARGDLVDVARLLLDLGASPDAEIDGPGGRYRALHQVACIGALGVAALLVERGADVDARDAGTRATPLGWALHVGMQSAIEFFARHTRDVFTLAAGGLIESLRSLLAEQPAAANAQAKEELGLGRVSVESGETPLFALPADEDLAIEVADVLLAFGADRSARNHAGQTAVDRARGRGLMEVAEWLS